MGSSSASMPEWLQRIVPSAIFSSSCHVLETWNAIRRLNAVRNTVTRP